MGTLPKLPLGWSGGGHIWRRRLRGRIHITHGKNSLHKHKNHGTCAKRLHNTQEQWDKGEMGKRDNEKGNIDAKQLEPKKMRVSSVGEKPSMISLADRHSNGSKG